MISIVATIFSTIAAALNASFADSTWNGSRIPAGQQCQKFGGDNPSTPTLLISNISAGASAIVLQNSDRNFEKMNNGGYGMMNFALSSPIAESEIRSVVDNS